MAIDPDSTKAKRLIEKYGEEIIDRLAASPVHKMFGEQSLPAKPVFVEGGAIPKLPKLAEVKEITVKIRILDGKNK